MTWGGVVDDNNLNILTLMDGSCSRQTTTLFQVGKMEQNLQKFFPTAIAIHDTSKNRSLA
jgi:hypothetical protein